MKRLALALALCACAPRAPVERPAPAPTATVTAAPVAATTAAPSAARYKPNRGPFQVRTEDRAWRDPRGVRDVEARIYMPDKSAGRVPVIVFSHGLGGSLRNYRYAGEHWASHGYLVVHPTHRGSDTIAVAREGIREIAEDASTWTGRPWDVSFVLDSLADEPRADLTRVGVAGHSFGAHTALVVLGVTLDLAEKDDSSFRDPRVRAGVAMSPPGPGILGVNEDDYERLAAPLLVVTGTKDIGPGTRDPRERRIPYDRSAIPGSMLVTIRDAQHLAYSDRGSPRHHDWILQQTTAWWDAWLKDDAAARAWLRSESLERLSAGEAIVESR